MSKPEDIQQDVWDVATRLSDSCYRNFSPIGGARAIAGAIAAAILAAKAEEREACAKLADGHNAFEHPGTVIAAAIRKRGEG